jgi:hypothetical protein
LITTLEDDNRLTHSSHFPKANLLWEAYKERLGSSDSPSMHFNLADLLHRSEVLGCLDEPFSHEEIDEVIKHLPCDKSPGLDGFNTDFVKRCL